MGQLVVFVKENSCNYFYSNSDIFFDPLVIVGFGLQDKRLVQELHRKRQKRAEKHMVSTCDLWLDIKAFEFPRYGIYSFMTSCNFLQNTIRLSNWLKILSLLKSATNIMHREINSILSQCCQRRNNRLFRGNNQLFFCSMLADCEFQA